MQASKSCWLTHCNVRSHSPFLTLWHLLAVNVRGLVFCLPQCLIGAALPNCVLHSFLPLLLSSSLALSGHTQGVAGGYPFLGQELVGGLS